MSADEGDCTAIQGVLNSGKRSESATQRESRHGRWVVTGWVLFMIGQLVIPILTGNTYTLQVINTMALYVLLTMSMNILLGYAGLIAFGHAGLMGIGAYTTALLVVKGGYSFWVTFPLSCLLAGMVGLLVGLPALLVKGHYLALVTLGFGEILRLIMLNWVSFTNGPNGISIGPAKIFGFQIGNDVRFFYMIWVFLVIGQIVCHRLRYSRAGRAMLAIKGDELAASVTGVEVARIKLLAFFMSAVIAGASGSLFAYFLRYVNPDSFTLEVSVNVVMIILMGGVGQLSAPWIGSVVLIGLGEYLRFMGHYREIVFGLFIMLILMFMPKGMAALFGSLARNLYSRWRRTQ